MKCRLGWLPLLSVGQPELGVRARVGMGILRARLHAESVAALQFLVSCLYGSFGVTLGPPYPGQDDKAVVQLSQALQAVHGPLRPCHITRIEQCVREGHLCRRVLRAYGRRLARAID